MQKINKTDVYNIITPDHAKLARKTFSDDVKKLGNKKSFIKQVTSRKIEEGVKTNTTKRLVKVKIARVERQIERDRIWSRLIQERLKLGDDIQTAMLECVKIETSNDKGLTL